MLLAPFLCQGMILASFVLGDSMPDRKDVSKTSHDDGDKVPAQF